MSNQIIHRPTCALKWCRHGIHMQLNCKVQTRVPACVTSFITAIQGNSNSSNKKNKTHYIVQNIEKNTETLYLLASLVYQNCWLVSGGPLNTGLRMNCLTLSNQCIAQIQGKQKEIKVKRKKETLYRGEKNQHAWTLVHNLFFGFKYIA